MMATITLHIPEGKCTGCSFLKEVTIDHNYYGECTTRFTCGLFDCPIYSDHKCAYCRKLCGEEENALCSD